MNSLLDHISLLCLWLVKIIWSSCPIDNMGLLNSVTVQQDGAPAHYAADMHAFLNNIFSLFFGWFGPLTWPPRSPYLTMCSNWLWSYVKENPYSCVTYSTPSDHNSWPSLYICVYIMVQEQQKLQSIIHISLWFNSVIKQYGPLILSPLTAHCTLNLLLCDGT
jgi:hypothetical protein